VPPAKPAEATAEPPNVKETPEPLPIAETRKENTTSFNPKPFFAHLRANGLRHRTTEQVAGTETIIAAMAGMPIAWVAYALATAWHETGGKMQPNTENLNYSVQGLLNTFSRRRISRADAERFGRKAGQPANQRAIGNILYGGEWGRANLGNTEPDDGWRFRGRGLEHVTGRRNYQRTGNALGLDLIADPDLLLVPANAARSLVTGMVSGRYTGHDFVRHLPVDRLATQVHFREARRIINGTDRAEQIAGYALTFQSALKAGGWG
jgi:predicted chitinase